MFQCCVYKCKQPYVWHAKPCKCNLLIYIYLHMKNIYMFITLTNNVSFFHSHLHMPMSFCGGCIYQHKQKQGFEFFVCNNQNCGPMFNQELPNCTIANSFYGCFLLMSIVPLPTCFIVFSLQMCKFTFIVLNFMVVQSSFNVVFF